MPNFNDQTDSRDEADDDYSDQSEDQSLNGTLSNLGNALTEMTDPSTTEEAREYSKRILEDYTSHPSNTADIEKRIDENSEKTKTILRQARERIAARKYNKSNLWLAMAAGAGAPTETGAFGESASNIARSLLPEQHRRDEWRENNEDDLAKYDQAEGAVDTAALGRKLENMRADQLNRTRMAQEALKTIGKRIPGSGPKGPQAVDRAFAKDYVAFIQTGASDSAKAIEELGMARNSLRGLGPDGKPFSAGLDDAQTGPFVGALPKWVREKLPWTANGVNTQELVEQTIQRSLRPILGAQFTEKEGENLIHRVYNPSMKEEVNAQRLDRLLQQLDRAYKQKQLAAKYYEDHGTLQGYHGKTRWDVNEFYPTDVLPGGADNPNPVEDPDTPPEDPNPVPVKDNGGYQQVVPYEQIAKPKRGFRMPWNLRFAEGGAVMRKKVKMPDGVFVDAPLDIPDDQVKSEYMANMVEPSDTSNAIEKGGEAAVGAGLTGLAAKYATKIGMGATNLIPGNSIKPGEKRVLQVLEQTDQDPSDLAARLRNLTRKRVPTMLMDVAGPEGRALGEASMLPGRKTTADFVGELTGRQKQSRFRVADQVNQALAPDPYLAQLDKLTKSRAANSMPLYKKAFSDFPALKSPELLALMQTESGQRAIKNARKTFKDKPGSQPYGKPDALGMSRSFSLEFLDQVKQEFDDMIGKANSSQEFGKAKRLAALRDQLRDSLDKATTDAQGNSSYKAARGQWEADSRTVDALKYGNEEYMKATPEEASRYVGKLNFTERDALRSGVAETLLRQLKGPYTDSNPAQKLAGSPDTMEKLALLFDKPKDFEIFKEALAAEQEMFDDTRGSLNAGKSARGTYAPPESKVRKFAKDVVPTLGVFNPAYWALKRARSQSKISDKQADEVIQILRSRDPVYIEKMLGSKFRRKAKRGKIAGRAGLIGAAAGAIAPFIMRGREGDEEPEVTAEEPDENDPTLEGLTPEQRTAAMQPAKFAKGGIVRRILVHSKTGEVIQRGQKVKDFRGEEHEIVNWRDKGGPSSGRVEVKPPGDTKTLPGHGMEYYPSVFDLELREAPKPTLVKKSRGGLAKLKAKYCA